MAKGAYIGVPTLSSSLGDLAVGSTIKLNVGGTAKDFVVVQQGNPNSSLYDASCDGTWLMMKDLYTTMKWESADNNDYKNSDIHAYLNGTFFGLFDSKIQSAIKQVKIPYHNGTGSGGSLASGANGLSTKIFLLSGVEVGWGSSVYSYFPDDGICLDYFESFSGTDSKRIGYYNGTATVWWLRSPNKFDTDRVFYVANNGGYGSATKSASHGVRPTLVLPSNLAVSNGTIDGTEAGVKDVARKIKKPYIGVGGVAHKVKKIYIGVNGIAKLCWSGGDPISLRSVGDSVYMNVNGERKEFIIVQKGNPNSSIYDASCDGVWLLMKDLYVQMAYSSSNSNYAPSSVQAYLNGTFLESLDAGTQSTIKQVKIPYINWKNDGNTNAITGSSGLSQKVFLLSAVEIGVSGSYVPGTDGARLAYFTAGNPTIAYPSGSTEAGSWWTRTPYCRGTTSVGCVLFTGTQTNVNRTEAIVYVRPAMIMPNEALVDDEGNVVS